MSKYSPKDDFTMDKVLEENSGFTGIQIGKLVEGTVIKKDKSLIILDIGGYTTGVISGKEIQDSLGTAKNLEIGDKISVMVVEESEKTGELILSIRKASQINNWGRFKEFVKTGEVITVIPTKSNKGGLVVDVDGIKAFIPVSQLAPENYPRVENSDSGKILTKLNLLIGKPLKVAVLTAEKETAKLILSERAGKKEEYAKVLKKIKEGDIVECEVTGISKFGLFTSYEKIEGLIHISEITWGHVKSPNEYAKIGDKLQVKVIGLEGGKISFSLKRLQEDPWLEIAGKYNVGDIIEGAITKVSNFGIFINIGGDINGLIHTSEIAEDVDLYDKFPVGDTIKTKVIEIDAKERRFGLTTKDL